MHAHSNEEYAIKAAISLKWKGTMHFNSGKMASHGSSVILTLKRKNRREENEEKYQQKIKIKQFILCIEIQTTRIHENVFCVFHPAVTLSIANHIIYNIHLNVTVHAHCNSIEIQPPVKDP